MSQTMLQEGLESQKGEREGEEKKGSLTSATSVTEAVVGEMVVM